MIEATDLSLVYQDHGREIFACRQMSISIRPGEHVGILGPSGSGKSSLLYLLSGLKNPTTGKILVDGSDLTLMSDKQRAALRLKQFGFVFQQPYLLGYLTALENVLAVSPDRKFAQELLSDLGLGTKQNRLPHELSGGERQRVCVARALVNRPRVIFADEPTAALDHQNGVAVVELLKANRGEGALVMVTHDPSMVEGADRVLTVNDGVLSG